MTFMNLIEWYNIDILDKTGEYPFGAEGPTPYYYKTADMYSTVMLVWGLLFFATLTFGSWTIIKGQRKRTLLSFGLTLLLLTSMFIHGRIGAD